MKRRKLTEDDWAEVFTLCCKAKRGETLTKEELSLIEAAFNENRTRYRAMQADVFDVTVPFGSNVRSRR